MPGGKINFTVKYAWLKYRQDLVTDEGHLIDTEAVRKS